MYKEQGTGSRSRYGINHMKQFFILNFFIGGVREYFANGFVLSLYQSCAHTKKNTFSFSPFFELAAERKLCYGGGDEENFK